MKNNFFNFTRKMHGYEVYDRGGNRVYNYQLFWTGKDAMKIILGKTDYTVIPRKHKYQTY